MFIPKRTKYKKQQKGKNFNRVTTVYNINKLNLLKNKTFIKRLKLKYKLFKFLTFNCLFIL